MSRKHVLRVPLFQAADASIVQTSRNIIVSETDKLSIHCKFDSAVSGEFKLYAQNTPINQNSAIDTAFEVPFHIPMILTAEDECVLMMAEVPFDNVYLVWTPDPAQSGSLDAYLLTKSVGA